MPGKELIALTPEEVATLRELAKPIHADWVADVEAEGEPGQAIYDELLRLVEQETGG